MALVPFAFSPLFLVALLISAMDVKHPELYRKLLRVYDSEMRKELDIATLVKTLETLKTIFANIVNNPTEEKFQRVPADNKKFVENVGDRKGGKSFLVAAGWLKKAIEHREFWMVNKQGDQWLENIQTALAILEEKHNQFLRLAEEDRLKDERQKKADAERAAIAMKQYEDDRATWRLQHELTGGTKDSKAIPFRTRDEVGPRPPVNPAGGDGGHGHAHGPDGESLSDDE